MVSPRLNCLHITNTYHSYSALPGLARRFQIAMPIEISYNYGVNKKANVREHVSPNVLENRQCLHFKLIKVSHHLYELQL